MQCAAELVDSTVQANDRCSLPFRSESSPELALQDATDAHEAKMIEHGKQEIEVSYR